VSEVGSPRRRSLERKRREKWQNYFLCKLKEAGVALFARPKIASRIWQRIRYVSATLNFSARSLTIKDKELLARWGCALTTCVSFRAQKSPSFARHSAQTLREKGGESLVASCKTRLLHLRKKISAPIQNVARVPPTTYDAALKNAFLQNPPALGVYEVMHPTV
jgi:hypothetical protein